MNWLPSTLGADPKKLAILGGLLVAAGGVYWINSTPERPASSPTRAAPIPTIPSVPAVPPRTPASTSVSGGPRVTTRTAARTIDDFRPTLKVPEGTELSSIDPSIRLDLLAKVQGIEASGGSRSLFEFSQPPP